MFALELPPDGTSKLFRMNALRQPADTQNSIATLPEFDIVVFSFLLHFVWEFVQAPTYSGMAEMKHWDGIKLCMSAAFGDVWLALTAFWETGACSANPLVGAATGSMADPHVPDDRHSADSRI